MLIVAILVGCHGEDSYEEWLRKNPPTETRNGKQGVGTAEKPVDTMLYGIRFQQKGLEIQHAEIFVKEGLPLFIEDSVYATDTVQMPLYIRGWHAPDGFARVKYSSVTRRPDGSIADRQNNFKEIGRFDVTKDVVGNLMDFADLDTTLPYYDCEFTITDLGNGRSLTGAYRYKLKRRR